MKKVKKEKKKIVIIIIALILVIVFILGLPSIINYLFKSQYNSKGISHFLVITIDKNQSKKYIGKLDKHKIYIEQLKIDEVNFRSIDAKNIPIKEAISKKLTSIKEWRKYAWNTKQDKNKEILYFENYKIVISKDECIIKPLVR